MLDRKQILFYSALAAIVSRGIFAVVMFFSPFRFYHCLRGLDMQTLLRFAEWGKHADAVPFFTLHRVLLHCNWLWNGETHQLWMIFLVQTLLGIAGTLAVAELTLMLTGKRRGALAAGIFFAFYLPVLIYEFQVLQETFYLNFTLLAYWSTLKVWQKRFRWNWNIFCGVLWAMALAGRPVAIFPALGTLIFFSWKKYRCKRPIHGISPAMTAFLLLLCICGFNWIRNGSPMPFYTTNYIQHYNAAVPADGGISPAAPATLFEVGIKALKRTPELLSAFEVPENLNVYFFCDRHPVLNIFPGSVLLIPCTAAALVILLGSGAWKKRYFLILLPAVFLALPLCAREVIGRYRLMLTPYFTVICICGFYEFIRLNSRKRTVCFAAALAAAGATFLMHTDLKKIRPEDHHAWAEALIRTPGTNKKEILEAFAEYYQSAGLNSEKAFRATIGRALEYQDMDLVQTLLIQGNIHGIDRNLLRYYQMWFFVLKNDPESVEKISSGINRDALPGELKGQFMKVKKDTERILKMKRKNK